MFNTVAPPRVDTGVEIYERLFEGPWTLTGIFYASNLLYSMAYNILQVLEH